MPRRITLLTTGLAVGGAETQVDLLARIFKRRGWLVEVVSMLAPEAFVDSLAADEIPLRVLGMRRRRADPRALFALRRHLRAFRPHVLHCHMVHANLLGRIAGRLSGVPVVISTAHSLREGPRWRDWAYRMTDSLCELTTNVSQAGVRRYVDERISSAGKTIWMPNGLDLRPYQSVRGSRQQVRTRLGWGGEFTWLAVGNLREPKDYPNLLQGFRLVLGSFPATRLAIAGGGPLDKQLKELSAALGIASRVEFLGVRRDIPELLAAADGYVISSAWEGTPMALLEASASALPIVATDAGGNREVVENGASGLVVDCKNAEALAGAMVRVHSMCPEQRSSLGEAARKRVSAIYDSERVADRWENVYRQLLASRAAEQRAMPWRMNLLGPRS